MRTKKVIFLGFGHSRNNRDVRGEEVWTINDWYNFPINIKFTREDYVPKPARVYQIHQKFLEIDVPGRMKNWRKEYEESGAEIVLANDVGLKNQRLFDLERIQKEFEPDEICSSFSYMFADAIWQNEVAEIELVGVDLMFDAEYITQVPGTLKNIEKARKEGIRVIAPYEKSWKDIANSHKFDWSDSKMQSVNVMYGFIKSVGIEIKI